MPKNKSEIYYEVFGTGQPILLIHGLGSSILDWEKQINYFSRSFKIIAADLRGHGKTGSIEGDYSIVAFSYDLAEILCDETEDRVTVIGISMGGMVAFQMAVDYPCLVDKLIIINSFVEMPMDNKANRKALRLRKLIPKLIGMKAMGKIIAKKVFPYKHQSELRKLMIKRWAKNNIKDYIKSVNAMAGWTVKNQLDKIQRPVLIIGSEFDYISTEEKKKYTQLLPNAQLVIIPDAHHAVTVEKPQEVNRIIEKFINE
ncbi:MAG: alpha/beta hydrolase [Bacteroidales bacterium]|nr:alpha/beta hydrolase [Bacteroidales bacterium]